MASAPDFDAAVTVPTTIPVCVPVLVPVAFVPPPVPVPVADEVAVLLELEVEDVALTPVAFCHGAITHCEAKSVSTHLVPVFVGVSLRM